MIYISDEFLNNYNNEDPEENETSQSSFDGLEKLNLWINDDDEGTSEAQEALSIDFANYFMKKVFLMTMEFYPQFHTKKTELNEELFNNGKEAYWEMYDMHVHFFEDITDNSFENAGFTDIDFGEINSFIHNTSLNYLLENYDVWFKQKISYENIYVESFYAGVYVKNVHNLLINMLHKYFPNMNCLSPEQLDEVYASLITEAWNAYFTLVCLYPDELNNSTVLLNLEDYDFESLLRWPGPEIVKNAEGKVVSIIINLGKPDPALIPKLCIQCKNYDKIIELNLLCTVNRFGQRNDINFKCHAFEKTNELPGQNLNTKSHE